jgi:hemerythrin-like domain-containing protein
MPIIETLAKDHRALEEMLTALQETASSEPQARIEAFANFQALLVAHSRAEEEVVYRRLRQRQPEEEKTLEAMEEHHLADILLQELASACPGGVSFSVKAKVLEELLRHHIKEEELTLFALVESNFAPAQQEAMDQDFRALKHERIERFLGGLRRATPAFAGRAVISVQAAAGRIARRGELYARRTLSRLRP